MNDSKKAAEFLSGGHADVYRWVDNTISVCNNQFSERHHTEALKIIEAQQITGACFKDLTVETLERWGIPYGIAYTIISEAKKIIGNSVMNSAGSSFQQTGPGLVAGAGAGLGAGARGQFTFVQNMPRLATHPGLPTGTLYSHGQYM